MLANRTLYAVLSLLGIAGSFLYVAVHHEALRRISLMQRCQQRAAAKKRFDAFFAAHTFEPAANFIILSTPPLYDSENTFNQCLGRDYVRVVTDPLFLLAAQGAEGCPYPYRFTNVLTQLSPVDGGMRFTSLDPAHAGWWVRRGDAPIMWDASVGNYRQAFQPYRAQRWYDFSLGKFYIHALATPDCMTDVTFFFNPSMVNKHTVFIAWNTIINCYEIVTCQAKQF
jgi:hypothetical protein